MVPLGPSCIVIKVILFMQDRSIYHVCSAGMKYAQLVLSSSFCFNILSDSLLLV